MAPRVHQILATLGYGDAIGHEVLGIRRALRRAGYESEIIVETADPRLEDLTVDYRDMVNEIGPDDLLIHHFSLGSRASRTAFALPARMVLIYHNITPPEFFLGVHEQLVRQCYHGRRELLRLPGSRRPRTWRLRVQPPGARGAGFAPTAVLPVVPGFAHLDVAPDPRVLGGVRRRVDEHPVRRPRDPEQATGQSHPLFPRLQDAVQPAVTAAPRRRLRRLRRLPRAAARARRGAERRGRAHPRAGHERGADGAVRRRRSVPLRQRARGVLRAADRVVLQARPGAWPTRPRPFRRRSTAAASSTRRGSASRRGADAGPARGRRPRSAGARRTGCGARAAAREGLRRDDRALRRAGAGVAAPPGGAGRVRFLAPVQARRRAGRGPAVARPRRFAPCRLRPKTPRPWPSWGTAHDREPMDARPPIAATPSATTPARCAMRFAAAATPPTSSRSRSTRT